MINHLNLYVEARGKDYLAGVFVQIAHSLDASTPQNALIRFRQMMEELEMKYPVATKKELEIEILTHLVNPIRVKVSVQK